MVSLSVELEVDNLSRIPFYLTHSCGEALPEDGIK